MPIGHLARLLSTFISSKMMEECSSVHINTSHTFKLLAK
jgi:hypothetical protein